MSLEGYEWLRKRLDSARGKEEIAKVHQLTKIAEELGCSMAQLALAWCLKNPNVSTVITGASRAEQVHENMKALGIVDQLTPDIMEQIETILNNKPSGEPDYRE